MQAAKSFFEPILSYLKGYPWVYNNLKFLGVFVFAYIIYLIARVLFLKTIKWLIKSTKTDLDDIILSEKVLNRISLIAPLIVIYYFSYLSGEYAKFIEGTATSLMLFDIIIVIGTALNNINIAHDKGELLANRPIKGYVQLVKSVVYGWGFIILIGHLSGQSVISLITGLGALTAVLVLVFRDTILGLAASIQITWYNLLDVGDYVEVPKYNADGKIIKLSLHTVQVRNYDNTVSIVPTYKLLEEGFRSRGSVSEKDVRRIRRIMILDVKSITQAKEELIQSLIKAGYFTLEEISQIEKKGPESQRITNLTLFRKYLLSYIESRNDTRNDMVHFVRAHTASSEGLPVEISLFTTEAEFLDYEHVIAEILDQVYSSINDFRLQIYQKNYQINQ